MVFVFLCETESLKVLFTLFFRYMEQLIESYTFTDWITDLLYKTENSMFHGSWRHQIHRSNEISGLHLEENHHLDQQSEHGIDILWKLGVYCNKRGEGYKAQMKWVLNVAGQYYFQCHMRIVSLHEYFLSSLHSTENFVGPMCLILSLWASRNTSLSLIQ